MSRASETDTYVAKSNNEKDDNLFISKELKSAINAHRSSVPVKSQSRQAATAREGQKRVRLADEQLIELKKMGENMTEETDAPTHFESLNYSNLPLFK